MQRNRLIAVALLATTCLAMPQFGTRSLSRSQRTQLAGVTGGAPVWLRGQQLSFVATAAPAALPKRPEQPAPAQAKGATTAQPRARSVTRFAQTPQLELGAIEAAIAGTEGTHTPAVPAMYLQTTAGDNAALVAGVTAQASAAADGAGSQSAEQSLPAAEELAAMQAAIGQAQQRMSQFGVSFRIQAIAAAEQALQQALEQLRQAQSIPALPQDIAAAQQAADIAQAGLQQAWAARAQLGAVDPQAALAMAQSKLATLTAPAHAAAITAAQEGVAAAEMHLERTAGAASATKTAAEARMQSLSALVAQARARFNAGVQAYDTAMQGIDPQSGQPFPDGEAEARQQQYAAALAEYDWQLRAAEAELAVAYGEFEAARQHEISDVDAARLLLDQARAELARLLYGPSADDLAQAKTELAATEIAVAAWQGRLQAAADALAYAEAQLRDATAALAAAQSGDVLAVAAAQQLVDEATNKLAITRQAGVDSSGWMWPTYGSITSGFGPRDMHVGRFHDGIDIAAEQGTPIAAARDGSVLEAGWCAGYGYCVKIAHDGGLGSEYGHLDSMPLVQPGQQLAAGTIIGRMGTTFDAEHGGYSTGMHLHFTIRNNGVAVDPLVYLP